MDVSPKQQLSRPLNLDDLAVAWRLDEATAARIAEPLVTDLEALAAPGGWDEAGIPRRGGEIYRQLAEGRTVDTLAATYVTLFRRSAHLGVLDALTFACGRDESRGQS